MAYTNPNVFSGIFGGQKKPVTQPVLGQPAAAVQPAPQQSGILNKVGDFINSPGGGMAVSAGAGLLQGMSNRSQDQANQKQNAAQFAANMTRNLYNDDRSMALDQATRAQSASPLGADQTFAQRNALLGAILGNAKNVDYAGQIKDPAIRALMPDAAAVGGLRLPDNFAELIAPLYSNQATLASLDANARNVKNIDPRAATMDWGSLYGDEAAPFTQGVNDYGQAALDEQLEESRRNREAIARAIDMDIAGEKQSTEEAEKKKKSGGILGALKKIGKVAAVVAPIVAAPFTGGSSLALLALGAGSGAANAALSGGGLKGALMGGALGAIPGIGGAVAGKVASPLAQAILKNPQVMSSVASGLVR